MKISGKIYIKKGMKIFETIYENGKKIGDTENKKQTCHQHKRPLSIRNIDINNIVISNKASFGKKRFYIFHSATKMLKN